VELDGEPYFISSDIESFVANESLSDLDIYCPSISILIEKLAQRFNQTEPYVIRVRRKLRYQVQLDVLLGNQIIGVLDLHSPLSFEELGCRASLFSHLLAQETSVSEVGIVRLTSAGDAVLKYLSYLKSYWDARDKIRHVDWILENLSRQEQSEVLRLIHEHTNPNQRVIKHRKQSLRDFVAGLVVLWSPPVIPQMLGRLREIFPKLSVSLSGFLDGVSKAIKKP